MAPISRGEGPDREPYIERDRHGNPVKPGSRDRAGRSKASPPDRRRVRRASGGRTRGAGGQAERDR
jgi:hypothetical protein